jgi:hypothetical protein
MMKLAASMIFKPKSILLVSLTAVAAALILIYASRNQAGQDTPGINGSIALLPHSASVPQPHPQSVDDAAAALGADARNFSKPDVPLHPDGNYYHVRGSYILDAQHNAVLTSAGTPVAIRISPNTRIFRQATPASVAINAVGRYFEDINEESGRTDAGADETQPVMLRRRKIRLIDAEFVEFSERAG